MVVGRGDKLGQNGRTRMVLPNTKRLQKICARGRNAHAGVENRVEGSVAAGAPGHPANQLVERAL